MKNKQENNPTENRPLYTDENKGASPISYEEAQQRIAEQVARIERATMKTNELPPKKNESQRKGFLHRFFRRIKSLFRKK